MLMIGAVGNRPMAVGKRGKDACASHLERRDDRRIRQISEGHPATFAVGIFKIKELSAVLAFEEFHVVIRSVGAEHIVWGRSRT